MATLYRAKVKLLDPESKSLTLHIETIHPDAMYFSANLGFALLLMYESVSGDAELGKYLDWNSVSDAAWLARYARCFLTGCELQEVRTTKPVALKKRGGYAYWSGKAKAASATLVIHFTNAAWFAHLSLKSKWESATYDTEVDFLPCVPVDPAAEAPFLSTDYDGSGGWMKVPSRFIDYDTAGWPELVYIPTFSRKSYRQVNKLESAGLNMTLMKGLLFKTLFVLTKQRDKHFGVLILWGGDEFGLFCTQDENYGVNTFTMSDVVSVGEAGLKEDSSDKLIAFTGKKIAARGIADILSGLMNYRAQ